MAKHLETGKSGELIAADYLRAKGYQILEMNKRFGKAEIDIIACIGNETVFVEVKTRQNDFFGYPEEFVDQKKMEMMGKAADLYLLENEKVDEIRFDLISLVLNDTENHIHHIEDAFFPGTLDF